MDRFNSNEEIEVTPLSIAKDIIYSDGTMDEKVKQIEREIIQAIDSNSDILKLCSDLSLSELSHLIFKLNEILNCKVKGFFNTCVTVRVCPSSIIVNKIKSETGFCCYHEKADHSDGRGTHVILIPIERYSDELKAELITKYDNL